MTALIETLGQVGGLPPEQLDQARDALFHADHPFLIVLVGAFNTGKSSLINALLGESVLGVGPTPTTDRIVIVRQGPAVQRLTSGDVDTIFHPASLLERASLVDTPGLESVFTGHDDVTRRFLHRADMVWMVMLATQAMSQKDTESLQALRAYGKRIVLVINESDLLDSDQRATLRDFVKQQAQAILGAEPDVWLTSAKWAIEAEQSTPRDETRWAESGFAEIERFISASLSDAARVRQKLETPLQIARHVLVTAQAQVRDEQQALTAYRQSAQNVRAQIDQANREQRATVQQTVDQIDTAFAETERRGEAAIRATFQLSHAGRLVGSGFSQLIGLARLFRRFGARTAARTAFDAQQVSEPLTQVPALIDGLGPRLEGRDIKDIDDLIAYSRRELAALPASLSGKLVGQLQPPVSYDRSILPAVREGLISVLDKGRTVEAARVDRAVQNTLIVLAFYEIAVVVLALVFGAAFGASTSGGAWIGLVLIVLALLIVGLVAMPVRGMLMARAFAERLEMIKTELTAALRRAAEGQIASGSRLRQDAVTPFLRLVESQTIQADAVESALAKHQQTLADLEKELAALKD
ncbi:MAG: dynamin family protein [Aggregatilineales bacterium]